MSRKIRDRQPYYEAYDDNGNLVAYGTSEEVNETIGGRSANSVALASKKGYKHRGYEIISPAVYRRTFDCYYKRKFVCEGTYEEIAEKSEQTERYVRYASTPHAKRKIGAAKRSETESMVLFEREDRRLEWLK